MLPLLSAPLHRHGLMMLARTRLVQLTAAATMQHVFVDVAAGRGPGTLTPLSIPDWLLLSRLRLLPGTVQLTQHVADGLLRERQHRWH